MTGQKLSVAGLAVGLIALALAVAALVSGGQGPEEASTGVGKIKEDLARLDSALLDIEKGVARIEATRGEALASARELGAKVERLSGETARLGRQVADETEKRSAAPAAGGDIGPARLRELVGAEVRAALEQARARQNQRGGPPRVEMVQIPQVAKDAAVKAVEGFKHDHAHPAGKTEDGKDIYEFHGSVNGRNYQARVTSDGKVLQSGPKQGRRRRPGGNRPQPRPADAAEGEGGAELF